MQKTHYLGGTERARISEQCLRRALLDGGIMLPLAHQSVRTRQVAAMVGRAAGIRGCRQPRAAAAGQAVATVLSKGGGPSNDDGDAELGRQASEARQGRRTGHIRRGI